MEETVGGEGLGVKNWILGLDILNLRCLLDTQV